MYIVFPHNAYSSANVQMHSSDWDNRTAPSALYIAVKHLHYMHCLWLVDYYIIVSIYAFADDVMPVLDIQNEMATCSSSESEIDAEYCLTVTKSSGRLNKHCHSGLARGRVHGAREVGCTVIQRANGSSSVITNQLSKSLASEPTAGQMGGCTVAV